MKRETMANHIKMFGQYGNSTWHSGLSMQQAAEIGPEVIDKSAKTAFKKGDKVRIHGTSETLTVLDIHGICLTLTSFGDGSHQDYQAANCRHGSYRYGKVKIIRSLCLLIFD